MLDLGPIKAREEAANEGPWYIDSPHNDGEYIIIDNTIVIADINSTGRQGCLNGDFIAHARADVPALIAEVEQLRADVERRRQLHSRLFNQRWTEERNNDDTK